MPTPVPADLVLEPLAGDAQTLGEWTNTFHLAAVVVDPFTFESAWVLDQAGAILDVFSEADCRACWIVTGTAANARQFLGPWAERFLTFADPDRASAEAFELERLPAFVWLNLDPAIEAKAEGWQPGEWQEAVDALARSMSWTRPDVGKLRGPAPFEGSPALG